MHNHARQHCCWFWRQHSDLCLSALQLPTQDEVEYWHKAEKSGWLQSQGEHLRTWRRRWFVLKQGFLFRFADQNVVAATKPRGIVDLSKVTDVGSGRDTTGKNNSITLSTEGGSVRGSLPMHYQLQTLSKCKVTEMDAWVRCTAFWHGKHFAAAQNCGWCHCSRCIHTHFLQRVVTQIGSYI